MSIIAINIGKLFTILNLSFTLSVATITLPSALLIKSANEVFISSNNSTAEFNLECLLSSQFIGSTG